MTIERLRIEVEGVVQGVGFRPFVFGLAHELGVRGFVSNRAGDVVIEAEAPTAALERFTLALRDRAPAAARVDRIATTHIATRSSDGFTIEASVDEQSAAAIAPDVATCDACVAEVLDAASRRYGYAFTSCAACGPRLTIITAAPYDRARTTMAPFALCDACRAEHDDPHDPRFHAQPIACPRCGPHLAMDGIAGDAIERAAAAIRAGGIVAIKGLGGYHLACDATRQDTVAELRRRKQRDAKPFAVMVADARAAGALAELGPTELALLQSPARPIVLARRRPGVLAEAVCAGVGDVGVLLPYTPLHHLLLRELPGMPLVMTSGNTTDEPIAFLDEDARARLGTIADHFVTHDRAIHMRCEDSVARVIGGAPMILRRARGYAPAPIRMPIAVDRPTLAVGGDLKAAFALAVHDVAFVSPHMGDLDELSAYEAYAKAIEHFEALHRVLPERVVCDRHPDYVTTRFAEQLGLPRLSVQHHHAHFASALADAGLRERAIGIIFDGAGYGDDGAIWGGEILVGDAAVVRRAFHLPYVPQPGGDRAAREPWRMAVAHLVAADEPYDMIDEPRAAAVAALSGALAPPTSSIGRLFDAVAAITGIARHAAYEGHAAMLLEAAARSVAPDSCYPLELAPMIRAVAGDVRRGVARAVIARRFHSTVIELAAHAAEQVARAERVRDVVLSGGVFQNAILAEELPRRLAHAGLRPHVHRRVPPNDGGLALGQLAVAAARGGN